MKNKWKIVPIFTITMSSLLMTTVACGEPDNGELPNYDFSLNKEKLAQKIDVPEGEKTLYLGLDQALYDAIAPAIKLLEDNSDYQVEKSDITSLDALKNAKGDSTQKMPSLFWLGDNDGMMQARLLENDEDRLFINLDLQKLSNKSLDPSTNVFADQKAFDLSDPKNFFQGMWQATAIPEKFLTDKVAIGLPMKAQPKSIYFNDSYFDGSVNIIATVPKVEGGFETKDTGLKLTLENVYKFIADAANNDSSLPNDPNWEGPAGWLKGGPLAQYQRIGSIVNSINPESTSLTGDSLQAGYAKDMSLEWDLVASLENIYNPDRYEINEANLTSEFTRNGFKNTSAAKTLWQGFYGYYQNDANVAGNKQNFPLFQDSKYYNENGEGELVFNQHALGTANHPWMHGNLRNSLGAYSEATYVNWNEERQQFAKATAEEHQFDLASVALKEGGTSAFSIYDAEYSTIPLPYSEAVTNSWAIPQGNDESQVYGAMMLIRAIIQTSPQAGVADYNSSPNTVTKANKEVIEDYLKLEQDAYENTSINQAFVRSYQSPYLTNFLSGREYLATTNFRKNTAEDYNALKAINYQQIPGTYRKTSSGEKWEIFQNSWQDLRDVKWKEAWDQSQKINSYAFTYQNYLDFAKEAFANAYDTIDL